MLSALVFGLLASAEPGRAANLNEGFGRFGYGSIGTAESLRCTATAIEGPDAEPLRLFPRDDGEFPAWRPVALDPTQTELVREGVLGGPHRQRISLTAPGITLQSGSPMRFGVRSIAAPYLTWAEGSVGPGVPSPNTRWLALSFGDRRMNYVLGFPAGGQAEVDGKPGNWTLTLRSNDGWVRIGRLPRASGANMAAMLGSLKGLAQSRAKYFTQLPPRIVKRTVAGDAQGVVVSWAFDAPWAIVPSALFLATLDGYPLQFEGKTERLQADSPTGPVDALAGRVLRVRFPVKRIPTGRAVGVGNPTFQPLSTVSPIDPPSVIELGFDCLRAVREDSTRLLAEQVYTQGLSDMEFSVEPTTQAGLSYREDGAMAFETAALALIGQCLSIAKRPSSAENGLLTSLAWRRDWQTWRFYVPNAELSRRVGAVAAVAGALCAEPERRLDAAMFEAGLAAERGLVRWKRRVNPSLEVKPPIDPLWGVRKGLFGYAAPPDRDEAFVTYLRSPMRVYTDSPVWVEQDPIGDRLVWNAASTRPTTATFASSVSFGLSARHNLGPEFTVTRSLGVTELTATALEPGPCMANFTWRDARLPLPLVQLPPRYSESARSIGPR
ncbi:MAG: hypothetical protein SFX74_04970 [Fimbriimonadaceae bacterium]|nr:hypothetical protein [Fimbriimonadaceae bacterium]